MVNDKESTLTGCVNRGAVTGNGAATGIGGVAGRIGGSLLRCAELRSRHRQRLVSGRRGRCVHDGGRLVTHRLLQRLRGAHAHTYASSGTGGLIGYGNDYRAENCFSYGAVSAAAGTAGGLIGRDSSRSTNVCENLYYRADSCGTAVGGKAEASGTAARTAAEFAALSFLRQLDKSGCFMLENGAYPELSASARCAHLETELRDARAATCTEAGYTGDTVCRPVARRSRTARSSRLRDISTATARAQCAARRTRAGPGRNCRGTIRSATSARATGSIPE